MPGIPLRVSTFTQRDAAGDKYRLRLAAQVGAAGDAGRRVRAWLRPHQRGGPGADVRGFAAIAGAGWPAALIRRCSTTQRISVAPGTYLLRFGVVDKDGRRGTVVHRLELPKLDAGTLATSDLIVGNLPAEGETLTPRVEPRSPPARWRATSSSTCPRAAATDCRWSSRSQKANRRRRSRKKH